MGALCEACDVYGEIYGIKYGRVGDFQCSECEPTYNVVKISGILSFMLFSTIFLVISTVKKIQKMI